MCAVVCAAVCFATAVNADVVRLKNGRSVKGVIKNDEGDSVVVSIPGGALTFPKTSVESIDRASLDENRQQHMQWAAEAASREKAQAPVRKKGSISFPDTPNRIYISAVLNRTVPVTLLLDTGAPYVIIRKGLARRLDVSLDRGQTVEVSLAGKTIRAVQASIRSINVGGYQNEDVPALILLQDTGFPDMQDGLLGLSFLNNYNFKIDYGARQLMLEEKKDR
jgi:clan AA aspartic protease (TIGR02281 family)